MKQRLLRVSPDFYKAVLEKCLPEGLALSDGVDVLLKDFRAQGEALKASRALFKNIEQAVDIQRKMKDFQMLAESLQPFRKMVDGIVQAIEAQTNYQALAESLQAEAKTVTDSVRQIELLAGTAKVRSHRKKK